ncbi:hypothetical protein OTU49_000572 [Cherax quadricarinatus]|uniref:NACHT domain-containing protein n=2 Tax=Cherax quadricarinatus TaxID=27406 RepID=A0AAW0XZD6_CHEQU
MEPMEGKMVEKDLSSRFLTVLEERNQISSAVGPKVYAFSILYNFVTQAAERAITDVLKVLYSQKYMKTNEGSLPVYDYCISKMHWNDNRIKKKFGNEKFLKCDIRKEKMVDVNFAYKVIVELCGNAFDWLSHDCRRLIRLVKNYKYKICQKYGLNDKELAVEMDRFFKIVKTIYTNVGQEFHKDFKENLEDISNMMVCITKPLTSNKILHNFLADVEVRKLITAQNELAEQYRELQVANPFTWMNDEWYVSFKSGAMPKTVLEEIYSPLKIGDTNTKVRKEHLLTTTKRVAGEEVITPVLLLNGVTGSGKTVLCYHLVQNWCDGASKIDELNNFDLVFLIEHSKVKSALFKNVMREQMLTKTCRDFQIENFFKFLKGLDILFIIDGYDKSTKDNFPIVDEIFEHLSDKRILMTTRPDCLANTTVLMLNNHVNFHIVEVSELDDPSQAKIVEDVLKHKFKDPEIVETAFNEFSYHHKGIGMNILDLIRLPLTACLYVVQWKSEEMDVKSATKFYDSLFILSTKKLISRKSWNSEDTLAKLFKKLPCILGKFAWNLLRSNKHILEENMKMEIMYFFQDLHVDLVDVLLPYLTCYFNPYSQPIEMEFSYINSPQQAYYASRYLVNSIKAKKSTVRDIQTELDNFKSNPVVLLFFIGHLISQNMDNLIVQEVLSIIHNASVKAESYSYWWSLYVESEGNETVSIFIAETCLPKFHWVVNSKTVVPALKLLASCPVQLESLKIDIPNSVDPFDIPEFLPLMKSLPDKLHTRYGKKNAIEVELHFWHHDEKGGSQPSDKFLRTLFPWGILVNFTGELGSQKVGSGMLFNPSELRTIRARLNTPGALRSLQVIVKHLPPLCRVVRITIDIPEDCDPASFEQLHCPNLELNFQEISLENKNWIIKAIKAIGGRNGIWRACFNTCTMDVECQAALIKDLAGLITNKLSIRTIMDMDEVQQKKLQQLATFTVNWI